MWQNYSQWTGEARQRYESDVGAIKTMAGVTPAGRQAELAKREQSFQKEMAGFEGGATANQLRQHWQQEGGGQGTMESFLQGKYGAGWQPEQAAPAGQTGGGRQAAAAMNPMAAAMAPVAGVGQQRNWWAL